MNSNDQQLLQDFFDLIVAYVQNNPLENDAVVNYHHYSALEETFDTHIQAERLKDCRKKTY
ncbi:hypothetical protein [Coleofasciculus sp. F4-SAH-05]|uniref:hypothetical protein n=1 Tax=Coleofasciculus sp. F4-SAH-05 TaxID=3069525 RepID=UPI0033027AC7